MGPVEVGRVPGPPSFEPSEVERSLKRPLHPAGRRMTEAEAEAFSHDWQQSQKKVQLIVNGGLGLLFLVFAVASYPDYNWITGLALFFGILAALFRPWTRRRSPPPPEGLDVRVVYGELWDARNPFGESHPGDYYIGGRKVYHHAAWGAHVSDIEGRRVRAEVAVLPPRDELFLLEVEPAWGDGALSLDADVAAGRIVPGETAWARWRRRLREWSASSDGPPRHRGHRSYRRR